MSRTIRAAAVLALLPALTACTDPVTPTPDGSQDPQDKDTDGPSETELISSRQQELGLFFV